MAADADDLARTRRGLVVCAAIALVIAPLAATAEVLAVSGTCREGAPQGVYELHSPSGQTRVVGAFSRGRRTGSFLFWTGAGVRVAHVPYDEGVRNGTLAMWYPAPAANGEAPRKLEAIYVAGRLDGPKRSWHANGRLRGEFTYDHGTLVEARAWDREGRALSDAQARALAARDLVDDEAALASLERTVSENLPRCGTGA